MVSNKVFVAFLGNGTQLDTDSLHPIFGASRIFLLGSGMDGEFLHPLWVSCKHGCCTASLYRLFLRSTTASIRLQPQIYTKQCNKKHFAVKVAISKRYATFIRVNRTAQRKLDPQRNEVRNSFIFIFVDTAADQSAIKHRSPFFMTIKTPDSGKVTFSWNFPQRFSRETGHFEHVHCIFASVI